MNELFEIDWNAFTPLWSAAILGGGRGQTDKLAQKTETLPAEQIPRWFQEKFKQKESDPPAIVKIVPASVPGDPAGRAFAE